MPLTDTSENLYMGALYTPSIVQKTQKVLLNFKEYTWHILIPSSGFCAAHINFTICGAATKLTIQKILCGCTATFLYLLNSQSHMHKLPQYSKLEQFRLRYSQVNQ